jgi:hypothetical protein
VKRGTVAQYCQPYQPEQNGRAERSNQRIIRIIRAIYAKAPKIPLDMWGEVLASAVYISNRMLNTAVSKTQVLEGLWTGQVPVVDIVY